MRGDFSRGVSARPGVARVLMQQGRVQLDADWNEAAAIADRRARIALADLLGSAEPFGVAAVPRDAAGYAIAVRNGYRFDGKRTHFTIGGIPSFGEHAPFTIEATVAPRAGGHGGTITARFQHRGHEHPRGEFIFRIDAHGRPALTRVEHERVVTLTATRAVPFDAHTEIAAVCDGHEVALYVAGSFAGSQRVGRGRHDRELPVVIGAHGSEHHLRDVFDGTIDALSIRTCAHRRERGARHDGCSPPLYTIRDEYRHHGAAPPQRLEPRIVAGAGRAYVGGVLCENPAELTVELDASAGAMSDGTPLLAYLEVWERLVTAAEDPSLADPALGGIDTTAQVMIEARVRVAPVERALARVRDRAARGTMVFQPAPDAIAPGNQLVRVEVHRSGYADETFAFDDPRLLDATASGANAMTLQPDPRWTAGQPLRLIRADGTTTPTIVERVIADEGARSYQLSAPVPAAPFRVAPIATVKWSSENASIAFALTPSGDANRFVLDDPRGRVAHLRPGDVVELIGTAALRDGAPGVLTSVTNVDPDEPGTTAVSVGDHQPFEEAASGGLLRVWSAFAPISGDNAPAEATVTGTGSLKLNDGLAVAFSTGSYLTGDYWWMPTRVDVDGLWGWPLDASGQPQAVPPFGVERRFAPLALLEPREGDAGAVHDLRRIIEPLADDGSDPLAPRDRDRDRGHEPEVIVREDTRHGVIEIDLESRSPGHAPERERIVVTPPAREPHEGEIVLSARAHPPHGYAFTGTTLAQRPLAPTWESIGEVPGNGVALAAALEGRLYAFFEASGELWFRDAREHDGPWLACASRDVQRDGGAFVALDGVLYALGGVNMEDRISARCDAYDPQRDEWYEVPAMRLPRAHFAAAAAAGRIVVAGGVRGLGLFGLRFASRRVESWAPAEPRWRAEPALFERRQGCATASRGRLLYLAGGSTGRFWANSRGHGKRIDVLAPFDGRSWERGTLSVAQRDARAAIVDETLVVVGGRARGDDFAPSERYRLGSEAGEPLGELNRMAPGLAAIDGTVYAVAGEDAFGATAHVAACSVAPPLFVHRRTSAER